MRSEKSTFDLRTLLRGKRIMNDRCAEILIRRTQVLNLWRARRGKMNAGAIAVTLILALSVCAAAAASYTATDLGTLGGPSSEALGLNVSGQVVGDSYTASGLIRGYLWDVKGGMQDLGTLPGRFESIAVAINDSGQVAGYALSPLGVEGTRAFLWDVVRGMQEIGATLGGSYAFATGINASGRVVGYSGTPDEEPHAFLWDAAGGMRNLGTLGGTRSYASAINASGQVVGDATTGRGFYHAFLWDAVGGMRDLGTLPRGQNSYATGINSAGQVVGYSETANGTFHAFLWDPAGGMRDLGILPGGDNSYAAGINDAGRVVGRSYTATGSGHAFVWDAVGGMQDLGLFVSRIGSESVDQSAATGINTSGEIVGWAATPSGVQHAMLWQPLSDTPPGSSGTPLTALGPAGIWVGLKNSNDAGIRFDLRIEVYRNGSELAGSGAVSSVPGGGKGFNNARQHTIPLSSLAGVTFFTGDSVRIKVFARNACTGSGKNSGTARLWYNDAAANSRFDATIGSPATRYLVNGLALSTSPGSGPQKTVDVAAGAKCSAYKSFGTWSVTVP